MLRTIALALCVSVLMVSCEKKDEVKTCDIRSISGFNYFNTNKTLIPVNTQNWWLYTDSIWDPATPTLDTTKSTLIKFETIYDLGDGKIAVSSTELLPVMTVVGDTIYSTVFTTSNTDECYQLSRQFFQVQDTVWIRPNAYLCPGADTVRTPAGDFSNNVIYNDGNALEYVINKGKGIVRITLFKANGERRRQMTLKEYSIR